MIDDIVRGVYPAGDRLPRLQQIAQRHGCGRGVAREALRALDERGLIEVRRGKGQWVLPPDRWDVLDRDVCESALRRHRRRDLVRAGVEAMRLLEPPLAGIACRRATRGDVSHLRGLVDVMRVRDASTFAETEADFHRMLAGIARNPFAERMLGVHAVLVRHRRERASDRDAAVVGAHETIVAALEAADPLATTAAVDDYVRRLGGWLGV